MPTPSRSRTAFARRLTKAMTTANVDRQELARKVGAHPNRVGDWMRGTRWPAVNHLAGMGSALGVSVDWLLTGRHGASTRKPAPVIQNREAVDVARDLARLAPRLVPLAERAKRATGR
jgi:transcriptional regulator with XRE-family HTH domain